MYSSVRRRTSCTSSNPLMPGIIQSTIAIFGQGGVDRTCSASSAEAALSTS